MSTNVANHLNITSFLCALCRNAAILVAPPVCGHSRADCSTPLKTQNEARTKGVSTRRRILSPSLPPCMRVFLRIPSLARILWEAIDVTPTRARGQKNGADGRRHRPDGQERVRDALPRSAAARRRVLCGRRTAVAGERLRPPQTGDARTPETGQAEWVVERAAGFETGWPSRGIEPGVVGQICEPCCGWAATWD